jgi:hypothetical protein
MNLVSDPQFADAFCVFDVHNLVGRCEGGPAGTFYNSQNYPTNVIDIGLSKIRAAAQYTATRFNANRICIALSAQESRAVRMADYPQYKGTRPPKAEVIVDVVWHDGVKRVINYDGVRDLMHVMSYIPCVKIGMPNNDGETDDAIASFVYKTSPKPCVVVTEDRDMWSLMSNRCEIISKPDKVYGIADLKAKFGITRPAKLALAKTLYGDDSDNIEKLIPRVTQKSFGAEVEACTKNPGETQWAMAFYRQIAGRIKSGDKLAKALWDARFEAAKREKWIRLRQVRLTYAYGRRDAQALSNILDWMEIVKKKDGFIKFAMM